MSDPNDLGAFLTEAWKHLQRGAADSRSPARYPVFATVSPDGAPEARTVALRAARRSKAEVEVHTDIRTDKIAALRADDRAALHVWLPRPKVQIRLSLRMRVLTGEAVEAAWAQVPEASRVSYGTEPEPGTPIDHVYDYEKPPKRARFAVLEGDVQRIDLVHLGARHRRAVYVVGDGWRGTWVAP